MIIAAAAVLFVPDWPENAKFLTSEERELIVRRLRHQTEQCSMDHWNKKSARRAFTDIKVYLGYDLKTTEQVASEKRIRV